MSWRTANAVGAMVSALLGVACAVLWVAAYLGSFIGNTAFIGHVSMLALVFAAVSTSTGMLAAWRADVPDGEV